MAVPKPLLTEFGIQYRLESCEVVWLVCRVLFLLLFVQQKSFFQFPLSCPKISYSCSNFVKQGQHLSSYDSGIVWLHQTKRWSYTMQSVCLWKCKVVNLWNNFFSRNWDGGENWNKKVLISFSPCMDRRWIFNHGFQLLINDLKPLCFLNLLHYKTST